MGNSTVRTENPCVIIVPIRKIDAFLRAQFQKFERGFFGHFQNHVKNKKLQSELDKSFPGLDSAGSFFERHRFVVEFCFDPTIRTMFVSAIIIDQKKNRFLEYNTTSSLLFYNQVTTGKHTNQTCR